MPLFEVLKRRNVLKVGVACMMIAICISGVSSPVFPATSEPPVSMNRQFSGFDAINYIRQNHHSLESQAESISHWAAYYNVNTILLINIVKAQPSTELFSSTAIKTLASSLASLAKQLSATATNKANAPVDLLTELSRTYSMSVKSTAKVMDLTRIESAEMGLNTTMAVASDTPPAFDLPFSEPQAWQFNGVHTWTGNDNGTPMSSLDFTRSWSQVWGSDTSTDWVTAAHDGEITVYSSCFVQVQHDNGWATRYYHLDNLQVVSGQRVVAGEQLANYADQLDQALCSGGSSTGPHLHFALLRDAEYFSLQDIALSGYIVHPGTSSYDSNRTRMWLEKRGSLFYAFDLTIEEEEGDNTIDYRYNGMWFSLDSNGHGLNIEITESASGGGGTRKTVFIVMYTYDDDGLANFYVGNRDFERWRSDESMVVDMLQTSGGDFSNLAPIDFDNPDDVLPAGQAEVQFFGCKDAHANLDLDERSSGQPASHSISLIKLIGVPDHVCESASLPVPES